MAAFSVVRDSYGPKKSGQMISHLNGAICFIPALAPCWWLAHRQGGLVGELLVYGRLRRRGRQLAAVADAETPPEETSSAGPLISWSRYSPVLRSPASCSTRRCACWRWR